MGRDACWERIEGCGTGPQRSSGDEHKGQFWKGRGGDSLLIGMSPMQRNVVIIMCRCTRSKGGFGVRMERHAADQWIATWAFAIKDNVAKKEGYDQSQIRGSFAFESAYPGCPHC